MVNWFGLVAVMFGFIMLEFLRDILKVKVEGPLIGRLIVTAVQTFLSITLYTLLFT